MTRPSRTRLILAAVLGALALIGAMIPVAHTAARMAKASPIYLTTYVQMKPTMIRNFNPFDPAGQMDFTTFGIYEPLMIVNVPPAGNGKIYPWLATSYAWSNGNKTLTFTIRPNVKWTDGTPLTAADVAFTFNYGKQYSVADQQGLWAKPAQLASVTAHGDQVSFNLTSVNTTIFRKIANLVNIIPQHIWSKVTNPATFQNPNPVGSGPFSVVTGFTPQGYVLAKNPYYWQPLSFDGIHVPSFTSDIAALAAIDSGQMDQTGNFFPNCEKAYMAKDPAHFVCDYVPSAPVGLWFNDQQYPFSLPAFRKAVSNAINRQQLYTIAEYGYEPPADAIGVSGPWPSWMDSSLKAQAAALAAYAPDKAKAALVAAGFSYKGGTLYDPKGHPVTITLSVISGWSDWVLSMQIIARDLKAIGITATVNLMQQPQWFDEANKGTLPGGDAHLHWVNAGNTPYDYFFGVESQESYAPTGTDASLTGQTNWGRFVSPQVTALLKQFRETTDSATQLKLIHQIEFLWLNDMPMIPLMYGADWSTYSTKHFTGWPTKANRYTSSSVNDGWARLKVWTSLKPATS